jgi:hypothetical protein
VTRAEARHARHRELAPPLAAKIERVGGTPYLIVRHVESSQVAAIDYLGVTICNSVDGYDNTGPIRGPWRLGTGSDGTVGRTADGYANVARGAETRWRINRTDGKDEMFAPCVVTFYATVGRHTWPITGRLDPAENAFATDGTYPAMVTKPDVLLLPGPRLSSRAARRWAKRTGPLSLDPVQVRIPPIGP